MTVMDSQEPKIRWLIRRDMPEVLEIEEHSFDEPWTESEFLEHLRQRNCIGMVAELDERVVGYVLYDLLKDSLEIRNLAVHQDFRKLGIARLIVEKLKSKLAVQRRTSIQLLVSESNLKAQKVFQRLGFVAVEIKKGMYTNSPEKDAYSMVFDLLQVEQSRKARPKRITV